MNPLVSVLVPSYNHAEYIAQTIQSVFNQTYNNIELIVIDDGSTDNSVDLLSQLQTQFSFKFISRENKGLINTLNEGLNIAKGKYFCVIASDDIFTNQKIELQVKFMEANDDYALCYGKMKIINKHGEFIKNMKSSSARSGNIFYNLYRRNFITAPTVMLNKDILLDTGGYSNDYSIEDYPLWLKLSKSYKIGFIDEFLVYYRIHEKNMSSDILKIIKETEKILLAFNIDKKTNQSLNKLYYRWFCDLSKTNHIKDTKYYMKKSFSTSFYKPRFWQSVLRYCLCHSKS